MSLVVLQTYLTHLAGWPSANVHATVDTGRPAADRNAVADRLLGRLGSRECRGVFPVLDVRRRAAALRGGRVCKCRLCAAAYGDRVVRDLGVSDGRAHGVDQCDWPLVRKRRDARRSERAEALAGLARNHPSSHTEGQQCIR